MPYNPGIAYSGAQSLQSGISQGAGRLADLMMKMADDSGKAKSLRGVIKSYQPDLKTDHMSLRELEGTIQGHAMAQAQGQKDKDNQFRQAQFDQTKDHNAWEKTKAEDDLKLRNRIHQDKLTEDSLNAAYQRDPNNPDNLYKRGLTREGEARTGRLAKTEAGLDRFNQDMAMESERLASIGLPMKPEDEKRIAARAGVLGDPHVSQYLHQQGGNGRGAPSFEEHRDSNGRLYATWGGQMLASPAPVGQEGGEITYRDSSGNEIGTMVPNGKGGYTRLPGTTMSDATRLKAIEANNTLAMRLDAAKKQNNPDAIAEIQGEIDDLKSIMNRGRAVPGGAQKPLEKAEAEASAIDADAIPQGKRKEAEDLINAFRAKPSAARRLELLKKLGAMAKGSK